MEIGDMKNIVVLKNLPSNIVEEAFVFIKPNMKIKKIDVVNKTQNNKFGTKVKNSKEYVVKEAEMLISNYISDIESDKKKKNKDKFEKKYKNLKIATVIVSLLLFISTIINFMK